VKLKKYHEKRNFKVTTEPKPRQTNQTKKISKQPSSKKSAKMHFVVQKHQAHRLHYDFRLEIDNVLKSWAVPKGPSLDPDIKRLAVHVEDHPLEYAKFEGIIPAGQYGAGVVMIWDRGTWECTGDPQKALKKGDITLHLKGSKLKGTWKLIKINLKGKKDDDDDSWLLFKVKDEFAKKEFDVLKEKPASLPSQFKPQMAFETDKVPTGKNWLHEIKLDGYRILTLIEPKMLKLLTRNGINWKSKLPELSKELETFPSQNTILDGEIVILDEKGVSDFQLLQNALKSDSRKVLYYVFDIPFCSGFDLTQSPLIERKQLLKKQFNSWPKSKHPHILYTDHISGQGEKVLANACKLSLEGIISKDSASHYVQKRDQGWLKSKCSGRQEFVICGFTEPKRGRHYFGSLVLGYYNSKKKLIYCGHVGTGFSEKTLKELHAKFKKYIQTTSSFQDLPTSIKIKNITWLKPKLICEIKFLEWTQDNILRQPSFLGLREDKKSKQVIKENKSTLIDNDSETVSLSGIKLTHVTRVFEPTKNITKLQVAKYYDAISDKILPHLINRPISIFRTPSDAKKGSFFQKHHTKAFPKSVYKIKLQAHKSNSEKSEYLTIKDKQGLMALVQFDALEIHPWGSQKKDLEKPDRIVFDLDPGSTVSWKQVIQAGLYIRQELKELGLKSFVKLSGGKGLHLVVPIIPKLSYSDIKNFTHLFATYIVRLHPHLFTASPGESKRLGKIFIDYLRNVRGATSVAPYSTRARPNAPVSMPISWSDLKRTKSANQFTLPLALQHLKRQKSDPWKGFFHFKQSITKTMFVKLKEVQ